MHSPSPATPKPRFLDRGSHPHIATLIVATALGALAMNIFLPSLPSMAVHFETDYAIVQLAVSFYLAATAFVQLVIGPLSDRYGRRPVMLFFLVLTLIATVAATYAPTVEWFLAARIVQARAIAGMVIGRAAIRDMVGMNEAASMIGYVTMGMTIAPMFGPLIGGYLDEAFGWQASFWVTFAFGLVALMLVWFDLGETNTRMSASMLAQFRGYPELFTSRRFWGYVLVAGFTSGSYFAYLGGSPFLASDHYALTPSQYGLFFALPAIGYVIGNFISGRYSVRFGVNRMMLSGGLVTAAGMAGAAAVNMAGFDSAMAFFAFVTFVGLGNGITLPSANAGIVSVRPHLAGSASGLGGFMQIGTGASLSVLAGLLLSPGSGPMPLILLMLTIALVAVIGSLYVIWVARQVEIANEGRSG